jgi:clan AA aspartic protease (TIGR02281 family)
LFRFIAYVGFTAGCLATTVWAGEPSSEFAALISMQKQPAGTFYVSASLDGHDGALPLLVDTGSSFTVLNEVLLKELKAHGTAEYVHDIEGMMADGSHRTIPIYRLTALRIGDACWIHNVEAAIFPADTRPILGMNVLTRLAPFTLSDDPATLALNKCRPSSSTAAAVSIAVSVSRSPD